MGWGVEGADKIIVQIWEGKGSNVKFKIWEWEGEENMGIVKGKGNEGI